MAMTSMTQTRSASRRVPQNIRRCLRHRSPLGPKAAARRRSRSGEHFRGHDYSGKRWREADLPGAEITRKVEENDMLNARLVLDESRPADFVLIT